MGDTLHLSVAEPSLVQLESRISRIHDHLYANARMRTPQHIFEEVGKLLHTGIFIEEERGQGPAFLVSRTELRDAFDGRSDFAQEIAKSVRQRFREMNATWRLYSRASSIELDDADIAFCCSQLSGLVLSDRNRDVFGDALEIFRSTWSKHVGGQFFTDSRITHLAITLLEFNPRKGDDLLDPAAGTGGFLLAGLNRIREFAASDDGSRSTEEQVAALAKGHLRGVEVDADVCATANATLAARLGPQKSPLVQQGDSLKTAFGDEGMALGLRQNSHICIATNPPFGTRITIKDPRTLLRFELARLSPRSNQLDLGFSRVAPRPPDVLFLELCIRLLKPGQGRLAIVLPYQIVSGPQTRPIREWLLRMAEILAVIDLPIETFQPHTGTKTVLLVARRRPTPVSSGTWPKDGPIFMAMPQWIGHDRRGNPVFRRNAIGRPTEEVLTDIPEVEAAYRTFRSGLSPASAHEKSFSVDTGAVSRDPLLRLHALYHKPIAAHGLMAAVHRDNETWKHVRLGDVVERIFFPTRFKRNYVKRTFEAVPFLGGANIAEWIHTADKWIHPDDPRLEELRVKAGWLLITRSGTTGIISSVPPAWDGVAMSEHVIRIIPNPKKLSPFYLEAFLRSALGQDFLARGVFGSVIDEITPEYIADLIIPVPISREPYREIIRLLREAQMARQVGIEKMLDGVSAFESLFVRYMQPPARAVSS